MNITIEYWKIRIHGSKVTSKFHYHALPWQWILIFSLLEALNFSFVGMSVLIDLTNTLFQTIYRYIPRVILRFKYFHLLFGILLFFEIIVILISHVVYSGFFLYDDFLHMSLKLLYFGSQILSWYIYIRVCVKLPIRTECYTWELQSKLFHWPMPSSET